MKNIRPPVKINFLWWFLLKHMFDCAIIPISIVMLKIMFMKDYSIYLEEAQ